MYMLRLCSFLFIYIPVYAAMLSMYLPPSLPPSLQPGAIPQATANGTEQVTKATRVRRVRGDHTHHFLALLCACRRDSRIRQLELDLAAAPRPERVERFGVWRERERVLGGRGCLEGEGRVFGWRGEGVWMERGGCLDGEGRVFGGRGCLEGEGRVFGGRGEGV